MENGVGYEVGRTVDGGEWELRDEADSSTVCRALHQ